MVKNKLERFAEMNILPNVVQVPFDEVFHKDFKYKANWKHLFFKNSNPLVLELGCGKGEYSVGLAKQFPEKNFLGVDIKGSRMWVGAKKAIAESLPNVGFLRTKIELLGSFFAPGEVDEIWITFPDPQFKKSWTKRRLTSSRFLTIYQNVLKQNGFVHLKTDNYPLHDYTYRLLTHNKLQVVKKTENLYSSPFANEVFGIKTFYESRFLEEGLPITYLKFHIHSSNEITEPPDEDEIKK